ncbi:MAG: hypothetical protein MUE52_00285 [Tabrizicola sp.]|jgi:hypothetical protein|nr:hypothetical protein [Tabrizicola sp.]
MKHPTPADLIRQEADLIEAGLQLQSQGLDLLLAEMRALANVLPGQATPSRSDAEVESDFDNMPV